MPNAVSHADYVIVRDGAGHYVRLPKLTTSQRGNLDAVNGMLIYNTTTNQVEAYQNGAWGAVGGASDLDSLTDVTITTPADNEVLAYDSTTGEWINQTASEAGVLAVDGSVPLAGAWSAGGYDISNLGTLTANEGKDIRVEMAVPTGVTAAASATAGTLAAGTYYYRVTALDGVGETIGSAEASATIDGSTNTAVDISWTAVTGAASYRVYGRASGAQDQYWETTGTSYTDDGTAGTAGTVPTATTAYIHKVNSAVFYANPSKAYFAGALRLGDALDMQGNSINNVLSLTDSESRSYGLHLITTDTTIVLGTDIPDSLAAIEDFLADKLVAATVTFQLTTKTYSEELDLHYVPMGTGGEIIIKGNGPTNTIIDGASTRSYGVSVEKCKVGLQDIAIQGTTAANVFVNVSGYLSLYGSVKLDTCSSMGLRISGLSKCYQDPACDLEVNGAGFYGMLIEEGSVYNFVASTGSLAVHASAYEAIAATSQAILSIVGQSGDYTKLHIYSNGRDGVRLVGGATGFLRYGNIGGNTGGAIYCYQQSFLNLFDVDRGAEGANGTNGGFEIYAEDAATIRYSSIGLLTIGSEGSATFSIHFTA